MSKTFNDPIDVHFTCCECGESFTVTVEYSDLLKWHNREAHLQDCFPYLSAGERELFLSRICDKCFKKLFGERE